MDPFRPADNWSICPKCKDSFGWNNEDGLVGQVCSCGHMFCFSDKVEPAPAGQICSNCHEYRPDVFDDFCSDCEPDEDEEDYDDDDEVIRALEDDDDGGCVRFSKKVTPDIKDLAEEMVTCINNCGLDDQEMTHYIANMIADLFPDYKKG